MTRILAVAGRQNSGKTHLIARLIAQFKVQGLSAAAIKHDGHADLSGRDDWEKPGSDTRVYAAAGADYTVIAGGGDTLWRVRQDPDADDPTALCRRIVHQANFKGQRVDLILLEGYKWSSLPKLIPVRQAEDVAWLRGEGIQNVVGVVGVEPTLSLAASEWPVYDENDVSGLCAAVYSRLSVELPEQVDV